jgi:hypothetical protein
VGARRTVVDEEYRTSTARVPQEYRMAKPTEGNQKGSQAHAEGQHGEKTRQRLKEQINDNGAQEETESQRAANDPNRFGKRTDAAAAPHEGELEGGDLGRSGERRLVEGRQQHDEAEKNSENTRLSRDIDRHGHDREEFQVPGGTENHPRG